MSSTETLTSLAMLKVNIDQSKDYLDYLRPFILQILIDHRPDPVTDGLVHTHLHSQFGLEIPSRAVQIVLKRLARDRNLKRDKSVYHISGELPDPGISRKKSEADRHIQAVVSGLMEFAKDKPQPIVTAGEAVTSICAFLSEFNIVCLRAYLRGTTIPTIEDKEQTRIVLLSQYVLHLQRSDPERFESFLVLVQGHMLANALLCPDLRDAPKTFQKVEFYLDTPLLVHLLGLEGELKKQAIKELIELVRNLGGRVATFAHSREEFDRVLKWAAEHVDMPDARGAIIFEARRNNTTKSDLLLLASRIDHLLDAAAIDVKNSPPYIKDFQIDEAAFEKALDDEITYINPRAKEYDINSVRSIYVLRKNEQPTSVEKSKAILVSSNSAFAHAAYEFGQKHEESQEVSSVITDFSLANMAWLKAPMGAPSIPTTELLAYSYAALRPSKELLDRYLAEIDKLEKQGKISPRDHQMLRLSSLAQEEVMSLTLGDETALTEGTVTETLRRMGSEIKKEEAENTRREKELHDQTRNQLATATIVRETLQKRIYWKCRRIAHICACGVSSAIAIVLLFGFAAGLGLRTQKPATGWLLLMGSVFLAVASLSNLVLGTTLRNVHEEIKARCLNYFLRQETKATGIDLGVDG